MTIKTAKIIYNISNVVFLVAGVTSIILMIGAGGALAQDSITFGQAIILEVLGGLCGGISYKAYRINERYENYINRKTMKNK